MLPVASLLPRADDADPVAREAARWRAAAESVRAPLRLSLPQEVIAAVGAMALMFGWAGLVALA